MYQKGRKKGTVKFQLRAPAQARRAALAGDFNRWRPVAMRRQKNRSFVVTVALRPGRYEYKFLLDGDWLHDTDVPGVVMNCHGTFNSVAIVE